MPRDAGPEVFKQNSLKEYLDSGKYFNCEALAWFLSMSKRKAVGLNFIGHSKCSFNTQDLPPQDQGETILNCELSNV